MGCFIISYFLKEILTILKIIYYIFILLSLLKKINLSIVWRLFLTSQFCVQDSSRRVARATADQESSASDAVADDAAAEDTENRDKRFLFGFGGGEGGGSGSAGGSGNFLFDIIRVSSVSLNHSNNHALFYIQIS